MTQSDPQKRAEWQKRVADYKTSGLTVAQFCRQADVTPHTFYYWRKRLRQTADGGRREAAQSSSGKGDVELSSVTMDDEHTGALVHFTWGSTLRISVPAHCVDAIRCVLDCASRAGDDAVRAARTFQEVVLSQ